MNSNNNEDDTPSYPFTEQHKRELQKAANKRKAEKRRKDVSYLPGRFPRLPSRFPFVRGCRVLYSTVSPVLL